MKNTLFSKSFLLLVCLFLHIQMHAQTNTQQNNGTFTLHGTVLDALNEPLPGCSVQKRGSSSGTITSIDGKFSISVKSGETLVFSFVGFKTQELKIRDQKTISVSLEENSKVLDEVQIIGYGTIKKGNLTTSVSKIKADDIADFAISRIESSLDGQLAGVQVQQSTGQPGEAPYIRVRGVGSINADTNPLYVIDGMAIDDPNIIGNLNINDVESMEVLKDASAAAIYGSRGSNGVIIISTKKGKEGDAKVDLKMSWGLQKLTRNIDMLNGPEYLEARMEARPAEKEQLQRLMPDARTYDHIDYIMRTALRQNYQLSVRGGTQKVKYMASMNYMDQEGIVKNTSYQLISGRATLQADAKSWLKFGLNLSPSYSKMVDKRVDRKEGNIHRLLLAPTIQPTNSGTDGNPEYPLDNIYRTRSAISQINDYEYGDSRYQLLGDISADIRLARGLNYRLKAGFTYYNRTREDFWPVSVTLTTPARAGHWGGEYFKWMVDNILTYDVTIKKDHNLNATFVYSAEKSSSDDQYIDGRDFPSDQIHTLNVAGIIGSGSNTTKRENSLLSYVARLNYDYQNKYLASVSFRRDGSSRFPNAPWGNFFAASAGWKISEEAFFKKIKPVMNNLKVRFSFGETGNNRVGDYASYSMLSQGGYITGVNKDKGIGFYPSNISNPDLTWEKKRSFNYGLDFGFFDNRISGSIDYYDQDTKDLLLQVPVLANTGFTSKYDNIGSINNKGIEFEITTRNLVGAFKWETTFNIAYNKNKTTQLGTDNSPIIGGDFYAYVSMTKVGYPVGMFYMHVADGVFKDNNEVATTPHWTGSQAGDPKLKDINGDNKIDNDDRTFVGCGIPTYNWGLTNKLSYRNFQLSVLVTGAGGNKIYNAIGRQLDLGTDPSYNLYKHWVNRWKGPNEPGDGMTPRINATGAITTPSTRWLYDGTFVRISNATLSYNFTRKQLRKIKLDALRLYASADNIHTFDHYPVGWNPQVSEKQSSPLAPGYDYGSYPLPMTISFGLNVTF